MLDPKIDVNAKPLVCKVCAAQCKPQGAASCCASNDFLRVCRYHYIAGTNVQALRELIELTLGMDNFCEEHRYLYEYVITIGNEETLGCKQCVVELIGNPQQKGLISLKLLNQKFFDNFNQEKHQQIEQVFQKISAKLQKQNGLQETLNKVDQAQKNIIAQKGMQPEPQLDNDKIETLNQLRRAFEKRLCSIADLKGYHEYLHDEFIEDKSLRKTILPDHEENVTGYDKKQIYEQLNNIQFI